jgi:hypothetical protein
LAICINSIARCPPEECGLNLDSEFIQDAQSAQSSTLKTEDTEYYYILNKSVGDADLDKVNKPPTTAKAHIKEGKDLTRILADLREFLGIIPPDQRDDAENIFLSLVEQLIGEEEMKEDSEVQDKIATLMSKIAELEDSLKKKEESLSKTSEKIEDFEPKIRKQYMDNIKKFSSLKDEDLKKLSTERLEMMSDAYIHLKPSEKSPKKLPKEKEGKEDSEIKRIDPWSISPSMYGKSQYWDGEEDD